MANTLLFWKIIGGYTYALKWRGRWYYVGNTYASWLPVHDWGNKHGYSFQRVGGVPPAVQKAYKLYGGTLAALKKHLPLFVAHQDENAETGSG